MPRPSERAVALRVALAAVPRVGMFRPDLFTLHWRAVVAAFAGMEDDGLLVAHDGFLVPALLLEPERADYPHVGRVCFGLGLMWAPIGERLRTVGRVPSLPPMVN